MQSSIISLVIEFENNKYAVKWHELIIFSSLFLLFGLGFFFLKIGKKKNIFKVLTLSLKWNSLTFHWLFPDQKSFFTDHFTTCSRPPPPLKALCYAGVSLILTSIKPGCAFATWSNLMLKMYEFYIRYMCLNKKSQTTGSKLVRKEHYITFCCIRWFVNMLYCFNTWAVGLMVSDFFFQVFLIQV